MIRYYITCGVHLLRWMMSIAIRRTNLVELPPAPMHSRRSPWMKRTRLSLMVSSWMMRLSSCRVRRLVRLMLWAVLLNGKIQQNLIRSLLRR